MKRKKIKLKISKWDAPAPPPPPSFKEEVQRILQENGRRIFQVCLGIFVLLILIRLLTYEWKGDVKGKVTFEGRPIPWGRITFVSQQGNNKSTSSPIKNGVYHIKNCPRGLVKIAVESFPAQKPETRTPTGPMVKVPTAKGPDEPPPEVLGQFLPIPATLSNSDTSNLEYSVGWGSQDHNLDLKNN